MTAAHRRWIQVLTRKILQRQLPDLWEWKVADRAVKPVLAAVRRFRVPPRVQSQIGSAAEDALRETLADARARTALEQELAALALAELGRGRTRRQIETTLARSAKPMVKRWIATRIPLGLARARKQAAAEQEETRALLARITRMTSAALHGFANRYNWDDGAWALDHVVRQPRCALGTALLVYWLAKPYWYAQWRSARASDDSECFAMLEYIEHRIARGGFPHAGVAFDPRHEKLTGDTYSEEPKARALPPQVFAATTKRGVVAFKPRVS